jgi:glycosyltransferase involved in cell wall biosynthesis
MKMAPQESHKAETEPLDVSIIIPCLNEEKSIADCVTKARLWLAGSGMTGEIVVVDNNSTDRTSEVAREAGATVIHEQLRGKGNAFQTGMRESRGRYIVMSDGDATYDLSNLDPMIEPLKQGYDMVIGNRLKGQMEAKSMPWLHRHVGNPIFNALIGLIARKRMGDVLSGLRAFTREAWEAMAPVSTGFELESEMCLRAGRHKLRVTDVPISYAVRRAPSNLHGLTHGWAITKFIVLESADLILIVPGLISILLGVLALASGLAQTGGSDVGSVRWQPVFAGGILVPGGIAFITAGIAAKWLAYQRGVARPGRVVGLLNDFSKPVADWALLCGLGSLLAGVLIDFFLLYKWLDGDTQSLAVGAVAQTLMVSGLSMLVLAVLIGVLRGDAMAEAARREREERDEAAND